MLCLKRHCRLLWRKTLCKRNGSRCRECAEHGTHPASIRLVWLVDQLLLGLDVDRLHCWGKQHIKTLRLGAQNKLKEEVFHKWKMIYIEESYLQLPRLSEWGLQLKARVDHLVLGCLWAWKIMNCYLMPVGVLISLARISSTTLLLVFFGVSSTTISSTTCQINIKTCWYQLKKKYSFLSLSLGKAECASPWFVVCCWF